MPGWWAGDNNGNHGYGKAATIHGHKAASIATAMAKSTLAATSSNNNKHTYSSNNNSHSNCEGLPLLLPQTFLTPPTSTPRRRPAALQDLFFSVTWWRTELGITIQEVGGEIYYTYGALGAGGNPCWPWSQV
jgi:hypothetical protein